MRFKLHALFLALACLWLCLPTAAAHADRIGLANHRIAPAVAHISSVEADESSGLLASAEACPGEEDADAPPAQQLSTMRCLVDFARHQAGLPALGNADQLERSADAKAADILRCDSFSHSACDRDFTYWMRAVGYIPARCWLVGENLAWGTGTAGSPGAIFRAWLHSPEHRHNILGDYSQAGLGLRIGDLGGRSDVAVWTEHFGSHCGA